MGKILVKNSFTATSVPAGLSAGELAVNVTDKKLFVGNAVGGVVTLIDPNALVTSVNGATGAITNVATTNQGNTFSVLQVMNAGITTANLYVTSGATFASTATFSASGSAIQLTSATSQISALNDAGFLSIFATIPGVEVSGVPAITLQDADIDSGGVPNISIVPASLSTGTITLGSVYSVTTLKGTVAGATFTGRQTFTGGITAANLQVTSGATFTSRASFSGGLTASNIFASSGVTFNSTSAHTGLATFSGGLTANNIYVSGGATFVSNISAPNIVYSVNGITGAVGLTAGSNITITQSGLTFTISSSGGGGGATGATGPQGSTGATGAGFSFTGNTYNIPFIYDGGLSANSHFFVDIYGGLHSDRLQVHGDAMLNANGFPLEMYVGSAEVDQFLVQHNISGLGTIPAINLYGYSLLGTTATAMDLSSNQIRLKPNGINDPVNPSTVTVFNNSVDYSTYDSYVKVKSPTVILGDEELDWDGIYIRIDQGEARTTIHGNVGIEGGTLNAEGIFAQNVGVSGAFIFPNGQTASSIVTSINGASGAVGLTAGSNITITQSGLTFTISSVGNTGATGATGPQGSTGAAGGGATNAFAIAMATVL